MTRLGEVMVSDMPAAISKTDHRYWYTGHIHQDKKLDSGICSAESFRSIAAKDAWSHGAGYRCRRTMRAITLHKTGGEDSRVSQHVRPAK
jgi:hypothetical protein